MVSINIITQFLKDNRTSLRFTDIEEATALPQSILSKAVNGHRELTQEQANKVHSYLKQFYSDLCIVLTEAKK